MVLGDNIFYGGGLSGFLKNAVDNAESGYVTVFGYYDKRNSCLLDDDDRPFLDVILEENSSEQYDVLAAKETKTWKESEGVVNLHFQ